jgi:hypothetical protein
MLRSYEPDLYGDARGKRNVQEGKWAAKVVIRAEVLPEMTQMALAAL